MNGFTKLFQSILTSSVWVEDDKTRIVWIAMLALAGPDGVVEAAVSGLASIARVDREDCEKALQKLTAPDPDSRSTAFEGRRIEKVEGGWLILNHAKYRYKLSLEARREYLRLKKQEYRRKEKEATAGMTLKKVIRDRLEAGDKLDGP